jgi:hypothetical protein
MGAGVLVYFGFPAAYERQRRTRGACYRTAIAAGQRQGASLWELRAGNDLASLLQAQGPIDEPRARLAPLYASLGQDVKCKDLLMTETLLGVAGKKANGTGRRT